VGLTEAGRAALSLVLSERRAVEPAARRRSAASLRNDGPGAKNVETARFALAAPVLAAPIAARLSEILREYERTNELAAVGLRPTRTILISGAPGVGKTMTMQYLA